MIWFNFFRSNQNFFFTSLSLTISPHIQWKQMFFTFISLTDECDFISFLKSINKDRQCSNSENNSFLFGCKLKVLKDIDRFIKTIKWIILLWLHTIYDFDIYFSLNFIGNFLYLQWWCRCCYICTKTTKTIKTKRTIDWHIKCD